MYAPYSFGSAEASRWPAGIYRMPAENMKLVSWFTFYLMINHAAARTHPSPLRLRHQGQNTRSACHFLRPNVPLASLSPAMPFLKKKRHVVFSTSSSHKDTRKTACIFPPAKQIMEDLESKFPLPAHAHKDHQLLVESNIG
ncbi:hypothetical protein BX666DRAFT_1039423 [Dichotomocladium elegans]|nr:hypothetical protein BX666DRAFT_1039423 [Dichotomocladium elegans]